jgi:hypothetical protein
MSAAVTLLSAVLDSDGYICIIGLRGKGSPPLQTFYAPGEFKQAVGRANWLDSQGYDAYFGTATFVDRSSRQASNAHTAKNFKLDLDIAPDDDRKFPSQSAAIAALKQFCKANALPKPTVVSSGWGIHVYWPVTQAMHPADAKLYADKLKALCHARGFKASPESTSDIARVLRVPGTHNHKVENNVREVQLLNEPTLCDTKSLMDAIDAACVDLPAPVAAAYVSTALFPGQELPAHLRGVSLDENTQDLFQGKPKSFKALLNRSMEGKGCNQIKDMYLHQVSTPEHRWRAALSIAQCCDDAEKAIHVISEKHPHYDFDETVMKARKTLGPYTCATIEADNPAGCKDCPHKEHKVGNKVIPAIKSPIVLADYIPKATTMTVIGQNKAVDDKPVEYEIPKMPFPYFRREGGGVYIKNDKDDDGDRVCSMDFYMVNRLRDLEDGYLAQFRIHHPKDGIIDFSAKNEDYGAPDKLRELLNKYGIMAYDKEIFHLRSYITNWWETLSLQKEVDMVRTQFGWTEGFKSFVIGDREVRTATTGYSRPAPSLANVSQFFSKKGDISIWKSVFNTYAREGYEAHAFCALIGFASPLMPFMGEEGMLVNAYNGESGTGKTTIQDVALSIWGNHKRLLLNKQDTLLAKLHRMGVHQNIPVCIDEVTKMKPDEMGELLLTITTGKGKVRMKASANEERINNTSWSCIVLTSANVNFSELIQAERTGVDGELARMLEVEIPLRGSISKEEADVIFKKLEENYGLAGEEYIRYVMSNLPYVRDRLTKVQLELDHACTPIMNGKERYWSILGATVIVGGEISQTLGLHTYDMQKMRDFFVELITKTRTRSLYASRKENKLGMLGDFCNQYNSGILVVDTLPTGQTRVIKAPHGSMVARLEKDTGLLFVAQNEFRKFMATRNMNVADLLTTLGAQGLYRERPSQKRLGSGTEFTSSPAHVYTFVMDEAAMSALEQ